VDATGVYWALPDQVMKVALDGGTATTLAAASVHALAVDRMSVYWTDPIQGGVRSVPLDGGNTTTLAGPRASSNYLAIDESNAYWTEADTACRILRVPIGGGTPTTLFMAAQPVTTGTRCGDITVDATSLYWTNSIDGTILKLTPK
jgi:hypothetical protein